MQHGIIFNGLSSVAWPAVTQLVGTKESFNIRKRVLLPQDNDRTAWAHQHGRLFIVLQHQYGGRDVT